MSEFGSLRLISNFLSSKPMRVAVAAMTVVVTVSVNFTDGLRITRGSHRKFGRHRFSQSSGNYKPAILNTGNRSSPSSHTHTHFLKFYSNNISNEACGAKNKGYKPKRKAREALKLFKLRRKNVARQHIKNNAIQAYNASFDIICFQEDQEHDSEKLFQPNDFTGYDLHGHSTLTTHWNTNSLEIVKSWNGGFGRGNGRPFSAILFRIRAAVKAHTNRSKPIKDHILVINAHAPHIFKRTKDKNGKRKKTGMKTKGMMEKLNEKIKNINMINIGAIFMMGDFNRAIDDREVEVLGKRLYNGFMGTNINEPLPETYVSFNPVPRNYVPSSFGQGHGPDAILSWVDPSLLHTDTTENTYGAVESKLVGSDHLPIRGEVKIYVR